MAYTQKLVRYLGSGRHFETGVSGPGKNNILKEYPCPQVVHQSLTPYNVV